jgi:hypothetical protein
LADVASVHLLYILNNPLSGTDPSGYAACGPKGPEDQEVCQVTVKTTELGSRIAKSQTFTVANNGGTLYITPGGDRAAFGRIEAAMIGAPSKRPNGPMVGPIPMKVGERGPNHTSCAKVGVGCDAEQFLYDPREPSWAEQTFGDIVGSFRSPDANGLRINPFTGQPVPNPQKTKENTFIEVATLFVPGPKGMSFGSRGSRAGAGVVARLGAPEGLVPGTTLFGDEMHLRMASWFKERFGSGFTMRVRRGETGIDVTANTDDAAMVLGARHAEFKPRSAIQSPARTVGHRSIRRESLYIRS